MTIRINGLDGRVDYSPCGETLKNRGIMQIVAAVSLIGDFPDES
jgi:hypothetical protein